MKRLLLVMMVSKNSDQTFLATRCGFTWVQQAASVSELKIQHAASKGEVTCLTISPVSFSFQ